MKKICFIVSTPMTIKAFMQNHIQKLSTIYHITVIANFKNDDEFDFLDKSVKKYSIPINRKISIIDDLKALLLLLLFFRKQRFDAIHSITPKAGLLAMCAGFFAGINNRFHTFTGQVWVTKKGYKRYFFKKIDKLLNMFTSYAFVDSNSQRDFLLKEGIISVDKSKVLCDGSISGVDTKRFNTNSEVRKKLRTILNIPDKCVVFLYLGRLNIEKGILDLADAFKRIACELMVKLLVVGPDEDNMKEKVTDLLKEHRDEVHFIGFTDKPENYMNAADIFCLPSYREGFGSVIIEAASVGIPAIGSNIYGISDAISDGQTGLLHKTGNIEDLSNKMEILALNTEERKLLGINAKKRVMGKFSMEQISDALFKEYINLVGN